VFTLSGDPMNTHGLLAVGQRPHFWRREDILRYPYRGDCFRPYNVRVRNQYELVGVLGQPTGGRGHISCLQEGLPDRILVLRPHSGVYVYGVLTSRQETGAQPWI